MPLIVTAALIAPGAALAASTKAAVRGNKATLPSGLVIAADHNHVVVVRDKLSVALLGPAEDHHENGCVTCRFELSSVTIDDDGAITVRTAYDDEKIQEAHFTAPQLEALLEVARAHAMAVAKRMCRE